MPSFYPVLIDTSTFVWQKQGKDKGIQNKTMKILVTGGSGFIGSAYVLYALQHTNHSIVNVDALTYAANPKSLQSVENNPRYSFYHADITDADVMAHIFQTEKPDAVAHLAAESHVDRSIDGPLAFINTNIFGTAILLDTAKKYWQSLPAAQQKTFRFHHISTDEVYGSLEQEDPAFTETTAYDPRSPYSASKASSDHLVMAWFHTYGLPIVISNCSNNYGPRQSLEKLIPLMLTKALAGENLPIYGTGENIRDWLHVEDHARGLIATLEHGILGEKYNIGGNNEHTNIEIVTRICTILDETHPRPDGASYAEQITFVKDRPGHDKRYAIDAKKAALQLGWHPRISFNEGLKETILWYMNNQDWWQETAAEMTTRQGLESQTTSTTHSTSAAHTSVQPN